MIKKLLIIFLLFIATEISGAGGIGIAPSNVVLDRDIKGNEKVDLPPIIIFNLGEEKQFYKVEVISFQDQEELKIDSKWFLIKPKKFSLEEGQSQLVEIRLKVPKKTQEGFYKSLVMASPDLAEIDGQSLTGHIATKLSFNVKGTQKWHENLLADISNTISLKWLFLISGITGVFFFGSYFVKRFKIEKRVK